MYDSTVCVQYKVHGIFINLFHPEKLVNIIAQIHIEAFVPETCRKFCNLQKNSYNLYRRY